MVQLGQVNSSISSSYVFSIVIYVWWCVYVWQTDNLVLAFLCNIIARIWWSSWNIVSVLIVSYRIKEKKMDYDGMMTRCNLISRRLRLRIASCDKKPLCTKEKKIGHFTVLSQKSGGLKRTAIIILVVIIISFKKRIIRFIRINRSVSRRIQNAEWEEGMQKER